MGEALCFTSSTKQHPRPNQTSYPQTHPDPYPKHQTVFGITKFFLRSILGATVTARTFLSEPSSCFPLVWKHFLVSYQTLRRGVMATMCTYTLASKTLVKMLDDLSPNALRSVTSHRPLTQPQHVLRSLHFIDNTRAMLICFPLALPLPPLFLFYTGMQ